MCEGHRNVVMERRWGKERQGEQDVGMILGRHDSADWQIQEKQGRKIGQNLYLVGARRSREEEEGLRSLGADLLHNQAGVPLDILGVEESLGGEDRRSRSLEEEHHRGSEEATLGAGRRTALVAGVRTRVGGLHRAGLGGCMLAEVQQQRGLRRPEAVEQRQRGSTSFASCWDPSHPRPGCRPFPRRRIQTRRDPAWRWGRG